MYKYLALLIPPLLYSCNSDNKTTSELVDTWITQSCYEDPELTGIWVKGEYEFVEDGDVIYNRNVYSDSDCVSEVPPERYIYGFPYTAKYIDLKITELTMEGVIGRKMFLELYDSFGYTSLGSETGFYHLNNGVLCFSHLFQFFPMGYSIIEGGNMNINFESCLVNKDVP